jgi:hypothetical protein
MRPRLFTFLFWWCVLASAAGAGSAAPGLRLVDGEVFVDVDAATRRGSALMHLRNAAENPADLRLFCGDFVSLKTHKKVRAAAAFLQKDSSARMFFFEKRLAPGGSLFLSLMISDFDEPDGAKSFLFNNNDTLERVTIVKGSVPLTISLVARDQAAATLVFSNDGAGILAMKNADSISYPVRCNLIVPGARRAVFDSVFMMPAGSTVPLQIRAGEEAFPGKCSRIKETELDGYLMVTYAPQSDIPLAAPPQKMFPLKINLRYQNPLLMDFIIILVLLSGGLISLLLNFWVPHKRHSIKLNQRLKQLASKTRQISTRVPSSLRVFTRIERIRLEDLLSSVGWLSSEAPAEFGAIKERIDVLEHRIDMVKKLDTTLMDIEKLKDTSLNAHYKTLADARKNLDEAAALLMADAPDDATFKNAKDLIENSGGKLKNIANENPELAQWLATEIGRLRQKFDEKGGEIGKLPKCAEIRAAHGDFFDVFSDAKFENKDNIRPEHYPWLNHSIERLYILRHYIRLYEAADQKTRERILSHEPMLIESLKKRTYDSLHDAQSIRWIVEKNVYPEDIEEALRQKAYTIHCDPPYPAPNEPVQLEIRFNNGRLDGCAALDRMKCEWNFGSGGQPVGGEEGWKIMHYFRNREEARITVTLYDARNVELPDAEQNHKTVQLQKDKGKKQYREQMFLEGFKMAVALAIAIVGLIAGAREQLLKLDLFSAMIGIFIIGFSADTIKNIVSRQIQ